MRIKQEKHQNAQQPEVKEKKYAQNGISFVCGAVVFIIQHLNGIASILTRINVLATVTYS